MNGHFRPSKEFDLIYVNGSNDLENVKAPDDTWKVRRIEVDFHRRMFEAENGLDTYAMRLFHAAGDTLVFADETLSFLQTGDAEPKSLSLGAGHLETRIGQEADEGEPTAKVFRHLLNHCRVPPFRGLVDTTRDPRTTRTKRRPAMTHNLRTFGPFLRAKRLAKGLSLRKFAKLVDVSPTYLSQVEQENVAPPIAERVQRMAELLGENAVELIPLAGRVPEDLPEIIPRCPTAIPGVAPGDVDRTARGANGDTAHWRCRWLRWGSCFRLRFGTGGGEAELIESAAEGFDLGLGCRFRVVKAWKLQGPNQWFFNKCLLSMGGLLLIGARLLFCVR